MSEKGILFTTPYREMQRVVVSGGASSGKTTLLTELKRRGHGVVGESARSVLRSYGDISVDMLDFAQVQRDIYRRQVSRERAVAQRAGDLYFFDRSLVDVIAYYKRLELPLPRTFDENLLQNRYDKIFFLERLPFEADGERLERSDDEAEEMHDFLFYEYSRSFSPIIVPVMPVRDRADFVLARTRKYS